MGPRDRVLASMPLFHIGGVGAALTAIHQGVPLSLLRKPEGTAIIDAIEQGCTRAFLVPAAISVLLDAGTRERAALASLSLLTYGGAPCPLPLLERALRELPRTQIVQVYGMTELCGTVTTLTDTAHRDAAHPDRLASAGQVIDGTELRVVDPESLVEVPTGSAGELWFRTPKRMTGYLGQPEATAEMLVDDGWVRTGDIGRLDEAGFVFIEGRLKDVIITGGENVYGLEVEMVLATHPAVAEAAVIGVPDPLMGEAVVAVVVAAPDARIDADDLIAYARQQLAGFKCPRAVVLVDELPRNTAGKVLKGELREYVEARGTRTP
jgi:acyl-CoA synthetase (AMP-forming)/AMP-acid ligase II